MISLETAQELKAAGIKPKYAVWLQNKNAIRPSAVFEHREDAEKWKNERAFTFALNNMSEEIWEEYSLDQLLAGIEGSGYRYILEPAGNRGEDKYSLTLLEWDDAVAEIDFGNGWRLSVDFKADSPTEAAAQARLWILEGVNQHGPQEDQRPETAD